MKKERTLIVIKPDGIQRTLVGEIIKRYERIGLKLVAMKLLVASPEHVRAHYTLDAEWHVKTGEKSIKAYTDKGGSHPHGNDPVAVSNVILDGLTRYMSSGPVIAVVLEGAHAVAIVRKLTGGTEPLTSDVGTIRGDFVLDSYEMGNVGGRSVRNLVHASGSVSEAEREIKHWFKEDEIVDYRHVQEAILYETNLDGILG